MRIEHTAIYVADLEAARDFFTKYFGAVSGDIYRNTSTGFTSYFLSFDEGARLEIMNRPNLPESPALSLGYSHIALSVGGKSRVDALTERLTADGYQTSPPRVTGDGYYEAVVIFENSSIEITE
ncbi:MAG: VOC family protein [Oscillospiraceae bacterium]|nr:VOC family protein [Oscillospiraceae bacterium]